MQTNNLTPDELKQFLQDQLEIYTEILGKQ